MIDEAQAPPARRLPPLRRPLPRRRNRVPGARSSTPRHICSNIAAMKRRPRGRSQPPSASRAAASTITFRQRTRSSAKSSTRACVSSTTRSRRHSGRCRPARHRAGGSRPPSRRICCHRSSTAIIRPPASAPSRFCPTPFAQGCRIERRRYEQLWAQLVGELYQAGLIDPEISPESDPSCCCSAP